MSETQAHEVKRPRYDPSADRQKLDQLAAEFSQILRSFCEHDRLLRGSLKILRRRCGHPRCRCARGRLHETLVFVNPGPPKRTIRKVTTAQYSALRKPIKKYTSLRRLRARLGALQREALASCDRLSSYRLEQGRRSLSGRIP